MTRPIPGNYIFDALLDRPCIVLACNTRIIKGVTRGILRAAKDTDAAVMIEIARSECNEKVGYIGHTPESFGEMTIRAADEAEHDIWALHADHIGIKTGSAEELEGTKALIQRHIDAGFTSFAIDASHLFDFSGETVQEELEPNVRATVKTGKFILEKMAGGDFGLEVEVGEIGRKDSEGMILTTPEEAVAFITALNARGIHPQVLAIANGSAHGNVYDETGKLMEQVSIDIGRTNDIADALKREELNVRIAQHGITGTPRELIYQRFPHGNIIKGNVGTFWQNIAHEVLKIYHPDLFADMWNWTLETYGREAARDGIRSDDQLFGKYGKFATKQFFDRIYAVDDETEKALDARAYAEALTFIRAFRLKGTASIVREYMAGR